MATFKCAYVDIHPREDTPSELWARVSGKIQSTSSANSRPIRLADVCSLMSARLGRLACHMLNNIQYTYGDVGLFILRSLAVRSRRHCRSNVVVCQQDWPVNRNWSFGCAYMWLDATAIAPVWSEIRLKLQQQISCNKICVLSGEKSIREIAG